ncbi:hypothetical protein KQX54_005833 [Cotesia glomerata]|uniref:Uncharacterized protein n=1 Tax=Cotesia glomerata TaxID=32391 RepID=A0AAV7IQ27_COTGL|nr:hypothetical protein KQX54_005833 [Cotesia glomerata]
MLNNSLLVIHRYQPDPPARTHIRVQVLIHGLPSHVKLCRPCGGGSSGGGGWWMVERPPNWKLSRAWKPNYEVPAGAHYATTGFSISAVLVRVGCSIVYPNGVATITIRPSPSSNRHPRVPSHSLYISSPLRTRTYVGHPLALFSFYCVRLRAQILLNTQQHSIQL